METVDKYLKESSGKEAAGQIFMQNLIKKKMKPKSEKEALKNWNNYDFNALRDSYYGVMENVETLASQLNALVGDTGMFSKDLKLAVKARDAFRKLTLGKYV